MTESIIQVKVLFCYCSPLSVHLHAKLFFHGGLEGSRLPFWGGVLEFFHTQIGSYMCCKKHSEFPSWSETKRCASAKEWHLTFWWKGPWFLLNSGQGLAASHNTSLDTVILTFACSFVSAYGPFSWPCEPEEEPRSWCGKEQFGTWQCYPSLDRLGL